MKSTARQLIESLVFSILLTLIVYGISMIQGQAKIIHEQIWGIMLFSALMGLFVAFIGSWGMKAVSVEGRSNMILGLTILRLIVSAIFIGVVLYQGVEDRIVWVIDFFAVYLFYLVFEILSILSNLRAISEEAD